MMLCWHYPLIKHVIFSLLTLMVDTYQNDFKYFTINGYKKDILNKIILNFHKWVLLMEM